MKNETEKEKKTMVSNFRPILYSHGCDVKSMFGVIGCVFCRCFLLSYACCLQVKGQI